ncbi:unnamed protein product [Pelagomonas calceolata]|uniref:Uncharacterized protein n=1 Tax=Pelagomonas calceolata TaxID=35677 RepID=A0A8J2SVX2_9STRA|nr:unnamed protein product [Pelagomonas calceolata]
MFAGFAWHRRTKRSSGTNSGVSHKHKQHAQVRGHRPGRP